MCFYLYSFFFSTKKSSQITFFNISGCFIMLIFFPYCCPLAESLLIPDCILFRLSMAPKLQS